MKMYFYIFRAQPDKIRILPARCIWLASPQTNYTASVILSFHDSKHVFEATKNRFDYEIDVLATKFLGIRLFADGSFVSDEDKLLFLLKYSGLTTEKMVDFPLI